MSSVASTYDRIAEEALQLPLDERSKLAGKLLESLDDGDDVEISPEWREELQRRVRDIDEGRAKLIPHDEVMQRVKARLQEVRQAKPAS
jgi:putative addiction module component (TIGR02574 family)